MFFKKYQLLTLLSVLSASVYSLLSPELRETAASYKASKLQSCPSCPKDSTDTHQTKFDSDMIQRMKALVDELGKPGTNVSDINDALGIPDDIKQQGMIALTMPGLRVPFQTNITNAESDDTIRLIYHLGGKDNFAYFDTKSDVVVGSGVQNGAYQV